MILLASVLKPVDDTRMLGKFAHTLAGAGYRVAVAGRASPAAQAPASVSLHPLFSGGRLSEARLRAQVRYWRLLRQLQPALVVVHAPELLPLTLLWQALGRGRRFIYDIRENYALNISTQGVYRGWAKRLLVSGLRWIEGLAARRAAALTLAEASYADELPFLPQLPAGRVLLLENKYQPAAQEALATAAGPRPVPGQPLRLLYSGTISELNGVREAADLADALRQRWPGGALLTIVGFCQQPELLREVQHWQASGRPLRLVGVAAPVPHATIVAEISQSHLGLALYRPHPSTWRCRPTKLFEYLARGLPVLIPANPLWIKMLEPYAAGLALGPDESVADAADHLVSALLPGGVGFYPNGPAAEALWAGEGKRFLHLLATLGLGSAILPAST